MNEIVKSVQPKLLSIVIDKRSFQTHIVVDNNLLPQFKKLISKALNAYPDCHPALKEFGDMLEHGKILQDYYSQRTDIKSPKHPDSPRPITLNPNHGAPYGELPICEFCGGKGAHHMHTCKVITGA